MFNENEKNLMEKLRTNNALLVVGLTAYTDKNGKERFTIHALRPMKNDEDGFSCEKISCYTSACHNTFRIGDSIQVYYGAPRMYNGSAWSPVEGVTKINGIDGNN